MHTCIKCGIAQTAFSQSESCRLCGTYAGEPPGDTPAPRLLQWDRLEYAGLFHALVATIRLALRNPGAFGARAARPGSAARAALFALLLQSLGALLSALWQAAFPMSALSANSGYEGVAQTSGGLYWLIATPAIGLIEIAFLSVYSQFMLAITGMRRASFRSTVRVICYAQAANALLFMPVVGAVCAPIWGLVLTVYGLAAGHGTSVWRVLFALLLPPALIIGILMTALFAFAGLQAVLGDIAQEVLGTIR
jgi:MFS family permease